jgi:hypothetical protein
MRSFTIYFSQQIPRYRWKYEKLDERDGAFSMGWKDLKYIEKFSRRISRKRSLERRRWENNIKTLRKNRAWNTSISLRKGCCEHGMNI